MSDHLYSRVERRVWADPAIRSLSSRPCGRLLWLYLLTCRHQQLIPGALYVWAATIARDLGWTEDDVKATAAELEGEGLIEVDWEAPMIVIPGAVPRGKPANSNLAKSWLRHAALLPECRLRDRWIRLVLDVSARWAARVRSVLSGLRDLLLGSSPAAECAVTSGRNSVEPEFYIPLPPPRSLEPDFYTSNSLEPEFYKGDSLEPEFYTASNGGEDNLASAGNDSGKTEKEPSENQPRTLKQEQEGKGERKKIKKERTPADGREGGGLRPEPGAEAEAEAEAERIVARTFAGYRDRRSAVLDRYGRKHRKLQSCSGSLKAIRARLADGYGPEDLEHVVAVRLADLERALEGGDTPTARTAVYYSGPASVFAADAFARSMAAEVPSDEPKPDPLIATDRAVANVRAKIGAGDWRSGVDWATRGARECPAGRCDRCEVLWQISEATDLDSATRIAGAATNAPAQARFGPGRGARTDRAIVGDLRSYSEADGSDPHETIRRAREAWGLVASPDARDRIQAIADAAKADVAFAAAAEEERAAIDAEAEGRISAAAKRLGGAARALVFARRAVVQERSRIKSCVFS